MFCNWQEMIETRNHKWIEMLSDYMYAVYAFCIRTVLTVTDGNL